jgi:hypothetical protein
MTVFTRMANRSKYLMVIFLLVGIGVTIRAQSKPSASNSDRPQSDSPYFPKKTFQERSVNGQVFDIKDEWYSSHLHSMQEPSLSDPSTNMTLVAYRFLWLRSFHNAIAVRLDVHLDGTGTLTTKETNGRGGYKAGTLILNESREITAVEVNKFLTLLQKAAFWSSPTQIHSGGLDGAQWILEGVEKSHYHVVDRWSAQDSDHGRACLYLLEQSKIKVEPNEMY